MKEILAITMGFDPLDEEVEYFYKIAAKDDLDYNFDNLSSLC